MTNIPPSNDAIPIEPLKDEGWFFIINDKRVLHIRTHEIEHHIRMGNIHTQMLAHSDSMTDPVPAGEIPALATLTPFGIPDKAEQTKIKNAVQNSIALFIFLILAILGAVVDMSKSCLSSAIGIAAVYALIYVPLRFKIISRLPRLYKWLGLIGGLGLILLLLLGFIGLAVIGTGKATPK